MRGLLVGLTSGGGAYAAHQLSGGHAAPVTGLVVAVLAVGVGVAIARWRIGFGLALALALAAQATSHLLMAGSDVHEHAHAHPGHLDGTAGSGHGALVMLLAHAVVAVVTAGVSRRVDQAVLDVLRAVVAWLRPRTWLPRGPWARTRFAHLSDARLLPSYAAARTPLMRRGPPALAGPLLTTP